MNSDQEQQVEIVLLGSFTVKRGGQVLHADDWPRKKASTLLKWLAFERRLLKDQVIEFLWPESDPASGANNLYKTIHIVRQTLNINLGQGAADAIFRFADGILSLARSVWVDVREFDRLCTTPEQRVDDLEQALDLYQGDLLPDDLYEEWTQLPRQSLHRRQREVRLTLAAYRRDERDYNGAITLLTSLLAQDPVDEPVHRELMRLYAFNGQRHLALRQYQECAAILFAEIDALPAPETEALYGQILSGELAPALAPGKVEFPYPSVEKSRPLFVGREWELGELHSRLQEAVEGNGSVIFITGEAGQGKTSLMAEFAYRAQSAYPELVVAAGACQALLGIADPYLPFRDLIAMLNGDWQRPWLSGEMPAIHFRRLQAIIPHTKQAMNAYAPDLAGILLPASTIAGRHSSGKPELNQGQIFDQIRQFLRGIALRQPLLLLLDDLQWIDTASANLLFYLGRQMVNSSVLILCAYRPSEVHRKDNGDHPLVAVVQELIRYQGDIRVDLDKSIPEEEHGFIDALIDSEPNRLDMTFREAMYQRTKGHPLFTVELLRALKDQGDLRKNEAGMWTAAADLDWEILPARIEAVIARRIESLPRELRRILTVASVEGESFSVEVVAQVLATDDRSLLQKLSHQLVQQYRLIREQGEWRLGSQSITRYQFRHNLFQQYLYQQLSAAERRNLHRQIAAVLEQIGEGDLDQLAVSLAHHYTAAGDAMKAVPYLCRAGDDARRRVALEEAIRFYESALENWQENNRIAKAEVLHRLGDSLLALGNSIEAINRYSEAEELYAQGGDLNGMGAIQRLIGRSYWEQGDRAKALEHFHRALALLEQESPGAEMARAISAIAQMHMLVDEYDEAISWGKHALSLAQALNTEDVILHALTTVGVSLVVKQEAERGLAMIAESQKRAEAQGLPHDACRAYTGWGDSLVQLERYEEARILYERMLVYTRKVHANMFEGVALVQLGYLDWWVGSWRQAWARREEILNWMAASPGLSVAKIWASNLLGLMDNDLGQTEKASAALAEYTEIARRAREPQTTIPHLGQLSRCAYSAAEITELMNEILELIDSSSYPRYEILPALRMTCTRLAQASGGDPASLNRLEKAHAQMQNRQSIATLFEVQAAAAGIRGEWEIAAACYRTAAENWEALKRPYDLLRTLDGLSRALISAHREDSHSGDHNSIWDGSLKEISMQIERIIIELASELDEPEAKQAFLASPVVVGARQKSQKQSANDMDFINSDQNS
jgi:predicted ATPase/DNA-binding SARP family transcriptional activator